jgi:hypothetical protein
MICFFFWCIQSHCQDPGIICTGDSFIIAPMEPLRLLNIESTNCSKPSWWMSKMMLKTVWELDNRRRCRPFWKRGKQVLKALWEEGQGDAWCHRPLGRELRRFGRYFGKRTQNMKTLQIEGLQGAKDPLERWLEMCLKPFGKRSRVSSIRF